MFSFGSPFGYDYYRPKQSSFSLFDDDPFSSGYYIREPSLFRSSSFRQPTTRCFQPQQQQQRRQLSDEEDDYDPFSELFSLGARSRKDVKKSTEVKNQVNNNEEKVDRQTKSALLTELNKSTIKQQQQQQDKELDSQRFDTDNEIIFKFTNYICENPSNVNVSITKDNYIILKTDGYIWKNRLPDNVEVEKASCTCINKCLSLRLPKKVEVQNDNKVIKNDVTADKVMNSNDNNKDDVTQNENDKQQMEVEQVKNETTKEDYDPFAPIVEDIIEDDI